MKYIIFLAISIFTIIFSNQSDQVDYSGTDNTTGSLSGYYEFDSIRYLSSIDTIDNLYLKYSHDTGVYNKPIVIIMHGYTQNANDFEDSVLNRFASYKLFCAAIGMRGRDNASGNKDSGGRELYDVYDGIQTIIDSFPSYVDSTKITLVGYSGGGGNAFGMAVKFPDLFTTLVSCFGISDYGYDPLYGWYQLNTNQQSKIIGQLTYSPSQNINIYYSRYYLNGLKNFQNGKFIMFHDAQDEDVNIEMSRLAEDEFIENSIDYTYYESQTGDAQRWIHGLPGISGEDINDAEQYFDTILLNREGWNLKNQSQMFIAGFIKTKQFEIWLGDGTEEAANLSYNISMARFTITPLTGSMSVSVIFNSDTTNKTINTVTTFLF